MKKILSICLILCVSAFVFADSLFSFKAVSQVPLYAEAIADPYAMSTNLAIIYATDLNQRPNQILSIITDKTENRVFYDYLKYDDDAFKDSNRMYIHMKGGTSVGLMRFRYEGSNIIPSIEAELNLAGYINTLFCMFGKNDTLDFDGSYFIGASMRVAEMFSFRFGLHHFSGHYGDEMLSKYYGYNNVDASDKYNNGYHFTYEKAQAGHEYYLVDPVEYVRDNSYLLGASLNTPAVNRFSVRVYAEAELPKNPSWLRPFVHVPADYKNPVKESNRPTLIDRIGGNAIDGEQFPEGQLNAEQELKRTSNGSYKAWRIHTGLELRYSVGFGTIFLAGDIQFHQDGQTGHMVGQYNKEKCWEVEYTVGGGLELGDVTKDGKVARLNILYHDGRTPATQFFYQRMKYFSVGVSIN